jgi:hypothetical protein
MDALRASILGKNKVSTKHEDSVSTDKDDPMAALRAQIMGRQKQRHTSMVDMLAEKYGGGSTKGGNKKKRGRK